MHCLPMFRFWSGIAVGRRNPFLLGGGAYIKQNTKVVREAAKKIGPFSFGPKMLANFLLLSF